MVGSSIIRPVIFSTSRSVTAAFSTRAGGVSPDPYGMNLSFNVGDDRVNVVRNRELFFGKLHIGLDELAIPVQRHTTKVVHAKTWGGFEECDGLVTSEPGVFLVVTIADCMPILIFDKGRKAVAALHAGWRGAADGIVRAGLAAMNAEFGTRPDECLVCVGPSAGVCCYEVDEDVAGRFPADVVDRSGAKPKLDLRQSARNQLIAAGVQPDNIEVTAKCTIHESGLFHSYRRDGKQSGRMMGVIGIVR